MITVARTADSTYELRDVDGAVIKTYDQSEMTHPSDWIEDAVAAGFDGWAISSGGLTYVDERDGS